MAENLDDGEFWLPSEFLTDDILMENQNSMGFNNERKAHFPCEFPYGFDSSESSLSSPVESVVGSTETESDEDDYMAGLSRQMTQSMVFEEEKLVFPAFWNDNSKAKKVMAGSPQSTLCEVGSWLRCSNGSSQASSNVPSQVSSPPTTPMDQKQDAWDLLYAAAGQVVKMKMNDQGLNSHCRGLLGSPRKPSPAPVSTPVKPPSPSYYCDEALNHLQMQHNQFQLLKKQQQLLKQQTSASWGKQVKASPVMQQQQQLLQNRGRAVGIGGYGRCGRSVGMSSSPWPVPSSQPQLQSGSGMRAVFLDGSGSKKGSSGTGVFLPRRVGNPVELRKKPACSTVLVPARVVQALNLNLDELGSAHPRFQGRMFHDHESMIAPRSNPPFSPQKRSIRPHPSTSPNYEIRLPQEWTY